MQVTFSQHSPSAFRFFSGSLPVWVNLVQVLMNVVQVLSERRSGFEVNVVQVLHPQKVNVVQVLGGAYNRLNCGVLYRVCG